MSLLLLFLGLWIDLSLQHLQIIDSLLQGISLSGIHKCLRLPVNLLEDSLRLLEVIPIGRSIREVLLVDLDGMLIDIYNKNQSISKKVILIKNQFIQDY